MDRDPNTEHKRNAWPSRLARVYLTLMCAVREAGRADRPPDPAGHSNAHITPYLSLHVVAVGRLLRSCKQTCSSSRFAPRWFAPPSAARGRRSLSDAARRRLWRRADASCRALRLYAVMIPATTQATETATTAARALNSQNAIMGRTARTAAIAAVRPPPPSRQCRRPRPRCHRNHLRPPVMPSPRSPSCTRLRGGQTGLTMMAG